MHQVRQDRLRAELPQKRCDLPAMIASVIHDMLHRLPERIAVNAELQRLVLHNTIEVRLRQPAHKTKQARFEFVQGSRKPATSLNCVVSGSDAGERP